MQLEQPTNVVKVTQVFLQCTKSISLVHLFFFLCFSLFGSFSLHFCSWMYWSDWGVVAKIERASMDGRSRQIIHSSQLVWPNGLTLDYQNQVLYWIDGSLDKIESSNVDGTNRRLILSLALSSLNYQGFALSFFNNTLYWSDWGRDMVFSVFANGTSITSLLQGFSIPTGIEVVSENRQQLPPGWLTHTVK